jgi:hypothetical protein
MPKPEGSFAALMKPKATTTKDRQLLTEQTHEVDASVLKKNSLGKITQNLKAGFDVNPVLKTEPDELVFSFDLNGPATALPKGSRVVQWVTFTNPKKKKEKPMTLACTTLIGDPYQSQVLTWKTFASMKDNSKVVKNKRFRKVNKKQRTKKKNSFKLIQSAEWYELVETKDAAGQI